MEAVQPVVAIDGGGRQHVVDHDQRYAGRGEQRQRLRRSRIPQREDVPSPASPASSQTSEEDPDPEPPAPAHFSTRMVEDSEEEDLPDIKVGIRAYTALRAD